MTRPTPQRCSRCGHWFEGSDCIDANPVCPDCEVKPADVNIAPPFTDKGQKLLKAIEREINSLGLENESNTPDFILAEFMLDCLTALNRAVKARDQYYNVKTNGTSITKFSS